MSPRARGRFGRRVVVVSAARREERRGRTRAALHGQSVEAWRGSGTISAMRRRRSAWSSASSNAEPRRRLLLEPLPEVDRLPEGASDVAHVVVRIRRFQGGERARIGPALEEAALVPSVDRRVDGARMPVEERHEPGLHVPVETLDGGEDLAAAQLLRGPERVVPEVARELGEVGLPRGASARRRRRLRASRSASPPVDEHAGTRGRAVSDILACSRSSRRTRGRAGSRRPRRSRRAHGVRAGRPAWPPETSAPARRTRRPKSSPRRTAPGRRR